METPEFKSRKDFRMNWYRIKSLNCNRNSFVKFMWHGTWCVESHDQLATRQRAHMDRRREPEKGHFSPILEIQHQIIKKLLQKELGSFCST